MPIHPTRPKDSALYDKNSNVASGFLAAPGLLPQYNRTNGKGRSQETGFIRGFPHGVPWAETPNLLLGKGPASLFIRVSTAETILGDYWEQVELGKDVLQREWSGLHSLTESFAYQE